MDFKYALTKYEEILQNEYDSIKRFFQNSNYPIKKTEVINNALQRASGINFYIQTLCNNYDWEKLEIVYKKFRESIEKLLTE